jgi:sugar lactone lactonase YvrE
VFGGDDLYELDPTGQKPPRLIRAKMGGFNSFWPGPDGKLYGPLWFKGQVVKVDPDTGQVTVVAQGLKTPASVKFDSKDNLYVIDTATGELIRIDPKTGGKTTVATLSRALDNFAIDANDHAYVTNMADNGVQDVDLTTGKVRQVVKGALAFPADIAADGETLMVADVFAYRAVDAKTGAVREIARVHADGSKLEYPTGVGVGRDRVLLVSSVAGAVMAYDKAGAFQTAWHGFASPSDVVELADGSLVVSELASGKLIRVRGEQKSTLAEGLAQPASLALGADGAIYVAEVGGGRISRVDPATGARTTVAEGLKLPKAVAVRDGAVLVLEVGAKQVVSIDPKTGKTTVLAANLPVGLVTQPVPLAGGLASTPSGVYVTSDVENAVYRLTPR